MRGCDIPAMPPTFLFQARAIYAKYDIIYYVLYIMYYVQCTIYYNCSSRGGGRLCLAVVPPAVQQNPHAALPLPGARGIAFCLRDSSCVLLSSVRSCGGRRTCCARRFRPTGSGCVQRAPPCGKARSARARRARSGIGRTSLKAPEIGGKAA